jgi:hypothetical protein
MNREERRVLRRIYKNLGELIKTDLDALRSRREEEAVREREVVEEPVREREVAEEPVRERDTEVEPLPIREEDPVRDTPDPDEGRVPPREDPPVYSSAGVERWDVVTPQRVSFEYTGSEDLNQAWFQWHSRQTDQEVYSPFIVGVRGDAGGINLGGKYCNHKGFAANVIFVGLDDNAVIGPIGHGSDYPVDRVEFHNIGIRGNPDSFAWRQGAPLGDVAFKNFWFVKHPKVELYTSLIHFQKGWKSLSIEGYQPRDIRSREHMAYIKGGGKTQIIDNDMRGGNRSFVHYRPHGYGCISYCFNATPQPSGPILIEGNRSDGFGWDHENSDGGAVISVWCSLEQPLVIRNNAIRDCRYGGIMIGKGALNTNPYTTRDGYSHAFVWIEDNDIHCTGKTGSEPRHATSFSDIRELVFQGSNKFRSDNRFDIVVNAHFSSKQKALPVRDIIIYGEDSLPDVEEAMSYVLATDSYVDISQNLKDMVVPEPR